MQDASTAPNRRAAGKMPRTDYSADGARTSGVSNAAIAQHRG